MDKLRYKVEQEISKLKAMMEQDFDKYRLGLLDGYYTVLNMMDRVNRDETEVKNAYDRIL